MKSGQLYSFAMGSNDWSLMEINGVIFVVAAAKDYPGRISAALLNEFSTKFVARAQESWRTCKENGLAEPTKKIMLDLCEKYDDLSKMDAITSVNAKIDAVKLQMQDNIQQALDNCVKLEQIETSSGPWQNVP
jgi:hypothetical protein